MSYFSISERIAFRKKPLNGYRSRLESAFIDDRSGTSMSESRKRVVRDLADLDELAQFSGRRLRRMQMA